jgi:hypothetical protein
MYSPEVLKELAELRQKAINGPYTMKDMKRYVEISRQHREAAAASRAAGAKAPKRKRSVPVDADALLASLGDLK